MPDLPEIAQKATLERTGGKRPGRLRAFGAAVVAGAGLAVAFFRWLRR